MSLFRGINVDCEDCDIHKDKRKICDYGVNFMSWQPQGALDLVLGPLTRKEFLSTLSKCKHIHISCRYSLLVLLCWDGSIDHSYRIDSLFELMVSIFYCSQATITLTFTELCKKVTH